MTVPNPQPKLEEQLRGVMRLKQCGKRTEKESVQGQRGSHEWHHLRTFNHACAEKEEAGDKITPPGLPLPPEEHAAFITTDRIEAPQIG